MSERSKQQEPEPPAMHHREITLADGRYMIFYTFDGSTPRIVETGSASDDKNPVAPDTSPAANTDV